jgi:sec-independent protein translocase protein TatB
MFDVAWSEIAVIGAVALIVIGPKDLPYVLLKVGKIVKKIRHLAQDFRHHIDDAIKEAETNSEAPVSPWPRQDDINIPLEKLPPPSDNKSEPSEKPKPKTKRKPSSSETEVNP